MYVPFSRQQTPKLESKGVAKDDVDERKIYGDIGYILCTHTIYHPAELTVILVK